MNTWLWLGLWYLGGALISFIVCLIALFVDWWKGDDIEIESLKGALFFTIMSWLGVVLISLEFFTWAWDWLKETNNRVILKGRKTGKTIVAEQK